jgi:23S rRNA (guanosine2251-2'-O)-methyltransferase
VTDVHNAAAIVRTASFYGVDYVVVPDKKSFGLTPSFFRIASGAAEYVPLVGVSKLTKTLTKLKDLGVNIIALSEHAKGDLNAENIRESESSTCIVLGREDVGISNAVLRIIDNHISLDTMGDTQSLNVSIAAAVTMEKCFSKK